MTIREAIQHVYNVLSDFIFSEKTNMYKILIKNEIKFSKSAVKTCSEENYFEKSTNQYQRDVDEVSIPCTSCQAIFSGVLDLKRVKRITI